MNSPAVLHSIGSTTWYVHMDITKNSPIGMCYLIDILKQKYLINFHHESAKGRKHEMQLFLSFSCFRSFVFS